MGQFAGNILPDSERKVLFHVSESVLSAIKDLIALAAIGQKLWHFKV